MCLVLTNGRLKRLHVQKTIPGVCRDGAKRDLDQFTGAVGGNDFVLCRRHDHVHRGAARMGRMTGHAFIQNRSRQIDVAVRPNAGQRVCHHFGSNVCGRTAEDSISVACETVGQSPVHDENFAKLAQHYVFGLEITVDNAARMGECHCVGDS